MERLIDATRIEQYILNNCSDNEEINAIYAEIINAPTVDAVEVVRCKDCVFFHRYGFKLEYTECRRSDCHATEDGYCCWAERREDVQESD